MCTSIALTTNSTYTGRNLDLEYAFGEKVAITPRNFKLKFHKMPTLKTHQAIIGMASIAEGYPLYAEAVNESGVYMAGLNFPGNAYYPPEGDAKEALAPYELIPYLLGTCKTVAEAAEQMKRIPLLGVPFGPNMPLAPLHWHIADKHGAFVAESMADGVKVYPDPVGVLTNNPTFPFHLTNLTQYRGLSAAQPDNSLDPALELPTFGQGMGAIGLPGDWSPASRYIRTAFCKRNSVCEDSEEDALFLQTAKVLAREPAAYRETLAAGLRAGESFPKARERAALSCLQPASEAERENIRRFLSRPNNTLGLEYQKAILKYGCRLKTCRVSRRGSGYHSREVSSPFASATALRRMILSGEPAESLAPYVPENLFPLYESLLSERSHCGTNTRA